MKTEHGLGTLMTVFSGIATLMCLLVGVQLFLLEAQIGQAAAAGGPAWSRQHRLWQAEARTGAVMSLGAGVLIFLFGLRQHASAGRARNTRIRDDASVLQPEDLESLSVRVFEVDDQDRSVEITPRSAPRPARAGLEPRPFGWQETADPGLLGDPTDSIVRSIREAGDPEARAPEAPRRNGKPLPGWIFRRRRRP